MKYVIGIDLGTSSVKSLLVNEQGELCGVASKAYPLIQEQPGFSEQDPEQWVTQTIASLQELVQQSGVQAQNITGISFSGQMHGLVLLDAQQNVLRPAILWNDTRTTKQCRQIEQKLGAQLLQITRNVALEGFTLPKILWVQQHEPELFAKATLFLLPKDYLRYRLTGQLHMDLSDAAGTLLLNVPDKTWSPKICEAFGLSLQFCPPLVESTAYVGDLLPAIALETGLSAQTKVFAGGADNACGAVGAGILGKGVTLCSMGTSGVVLSFEADKTKDFGGKVHFFNHGQPDAFYAMGVTLGAGYSLSWLKSVIAPDEDYGVMLAEISQVPVGANGLLFTPYLAGERTPHADSVIRGSFIGLDGSHTKKHLLRATLEGITFSLNESLELFREAGIAVDQIISIGGGANNEDWLQMQADIFNATVIKLKSEQGPALGAAIMAAVGCGWYETLKDCADKFIEHDRTFQPIPANAAKYKQLFQIYKTVYAQTRELNEQLQVFR